jgi:iron complex outermembrane receptor protein
MQSPLFRRSPIALAAFLAVCTAQAQTVSTPDASPAPVTTTASPSPAAASTTTAAKPAAPTVAAKGETLDTIVVTASADASAAGLSKPYAGGQVARGGRAGLLGTQDFLESPINITSYTNELIQDQQARSVADVLQNDPSVRMARGYGNFQESYFIRGFIVNSDDIAYNGLYGLLPRQYISSELFERVEVLRGASAFLNGATPSGGGIGGNINLVPKHAPNEALSQVTVGTASGGQAYAAFDLARRFGPDNDTGIRINGAHRDGGTAVDNEGVNLNMLSASVDWRSREARIAADIGYQNHKLSGTRPNVTLGSGVTSVPAAPDASTNYAQPWTFSNERDLFGSVRAEYDLSSHVTAWAAAGARESAESNSLANMTVSDNSGAGSTSRFDNERKDSVRTAEAGLRDKFSTGSVQHTLVASWSIYELKEKAAYKWDYFNTLSSSIYSPVSYALPAYTASAFAGNDMNDPALVSKNRLLSFAVGDTLGLFDNSTLLTVGLRRQTLASTSYAYGTGVETPYNQARTSPMVGLVYKLAPSVSLYANYVEGLSQGETAPTTSGGVAVLNAGTQLAPYVSKQKEVGVKYDGGRIGGSIAVFSTEKPRTLVNSAGLYVAEGKDRHQGIELNMFGEAAKGLRLLGGITWLDAVQKSTGSASTDGKYVIGIPKFQGNIGFDWDVPVVKGLSVNSRLVGTGHVYADAANTLPVPGWGRLDLGARYTAEIMGKATTLRARVDNATNRSYWASAGGYPNYGYLVLGAPRTFSLTATVDF